LGNRFLRVLFSSSREQNWLRGKRRPIQSLATQGSSRSDYVGCFHNLHDLGVQDGNVSNEPRNRFRLLNPGGVLYLQEVKLLSHSDLKPHHQQAEG
jgi:hypothetical protein